MANGRVCILIVDDRQENLIALEQLLEDLDIEILTANSGSDALRHLLSEEFAVILLDAHMPIMDGFETAKLIRQRPKTVNTPIIFLTAKYIDDRDMVHGYSLGAVDYMRKPVEPNILKSKIMVFVELFKAAQAIREQAKLIQQVQEREFRSRLHQQDLEKQLIEQQSIQLEETNRLKGEFLANMSHEIRTPMNAIIGMSDILMRTELDLDQKEFVATIRDSSRALLTIINDILDFSKIAAGKIHLENVHFELAAVIEGVADLVSGEARRKELSLLTFVDPSLPRIVRGDDIRLRQVLLNLVCNAVKFTQHGQIILKVAQDKTEQAVGGFSSIALEFSVTDTGIGISSEQAQNLFQPFTQADGSDSRKYGGTGLGLSLSKHLIELMGGQIGVDSEEAKGSRFWFRVSLEVSDLCEHSETGYDFANVRLLIADSNPNSASILRDYTEAAGIDCEVVDSTELASKTLRDASQTEKQFELLLASSKMPHLLNLVHEIQADQSLSGIKIIIINDDEKDGAGNQLTEAGVFTHIMTPVKRASLLNCIAAAMHVPFRNGLVNVPQIRPASAAHVATKQRRILIVEDNPVNQKVALVQLERLGLIACAVPNGKLAIEAVRTGSYDLVLMDCQMPELDGFQATRLIRQEERKTGERIPIIGLTAQAMVGDRERCLAAGMSDYLAKPVTLDQLDKTIRRWLDPSHAEFNDPTIVNVHRADSPFPRPT